MDNLQAACNRFMTSTRRKVRKTLGWRGADFGVISIVHEMTGGAP